MKDIELSKNFPDQVYETDFVQLETKAVMKWIKAHSFVLSANIHGGMFIEFVFKF